MESVNLDNIVHTIAIVFLFSPCLIVNWNNEKVRILLLAFVFHIAVQPLVSSAENLMFSWGISIAGDIILALGCMFFFNSFIYIIIGMLFLSGVAFNMMGLYLWLDQSVTDDQVLSFLTSQERIIIALTILQSLLLMWKTFYANWIGRYIPSFVRLRKHVPPL